MLNLPLSQVETRFTRLSATVGLPLAVPAASTTFVSSTVAVAQQEMLLIQAIGGIFTYDSAQLTGGPAWIQILSTRWGSRIAYIPVQVMALPTALQTIVSSLLGGVSAQQGDQITLSLGVVNADAVNPHNVTAQQVDALVQPIRLVADIALARITEARAGEELQGILNRIRG